MECQKCGSKITGNFCSQCGWKVNAAQPSPMIPQDQGPQIGYSYSNISKPAKGFTWAEWLAAICFLISVALWSNFPRSLIISLMVGMFFGLVGFIIACISPSSNPRITRLMNSLGIIIVVIEFILWGVTKFQTYFWHVA